MGRRTHLVTFVYSYECMTDEWLPEKIMDFASKLNYSS